MGLVSFEILFQDKSLSCWKFNFKRSLGIGLKIGKNQHQIKTKHGGKKTKVWKKKKKFVYGWATTIVVSYTCSKAGSGTMESCVSSGISQGRSPDSANDKGDLSFVKQPRVLLVDKWDKNEHI